MDVVGGVDNVPFVCHSQGQNTCQSGTALTIFSPMPLVCRGPSGAV